TGIGLSGADAGDYTFNTTATAYANITTRDLLVSASATNKAFDGTTAASVTLSDDRVAGDDLTVSDVSATFADPDVATGKPVTVSGISVSGGDAGNYLANTSANATADITAAGTTASFGVGPHPQQYSDPTAFTVTLAPASVGGQAPATTVTFYVGATAVGSTALVVDGDHLSATLSPALLEGPGVHDVSAVFSGTNPNFTVTDPAPDTLTVVAEDARVAYDGGLFATTASAISGAATVSLSATIRDISVITGSGDAAPGDIRNATVSFINRDDNTVIAADLPVALAEPGNSEVGTVSYNWNPDIGASQSEHITVGVVVNGDYARDRADDNVVVSISRPLGLTVDAGGDLMLSNSSGVYAGDPGSLDNFGLRVKYAKRGPLLSGKFSMIVRSAGRDYQVTSNNIAALTVHPGLTATTADFNGHAALTDVTDPGAATVIDADVLLQVSLTDHLDPAAADDIAITCRNRTGTLLFSNDWNGTQTVQQPINEGVLAISTAPQPMTLPIVAEHLLSLVADRDGVGDSSLQGNGTVLPLEYELGGNAPNPFSLSTSVLYRLPEPSVVSLTVYDVTGRVLDRLVDGEVPAGDHHASWSGVDRNGVSRGAGVYYLLMDARSLTGDHTYHARKSMLLVR
ncbi:MAG: hypothetical protein E6K81_01230, partial [Candidatus Eisenbacteria bacterium]